MRGGSLRHLVSIERGVETKNEFGETVAEWQELTKAYAFISPVRGDEKYMSAEKHAEVSHSISMRYIDSISPKDRIVYGGRVFDIEAVLNLGERNRQLKILAREQV
jgi:SPP1 family predicted phage head-tail adaptor